MDLDWETIARDLWTGLVMGSLLYLVVSILDLAF